jgi:hypothetical protein
MNVIGGIRNETLVSTVETTLRRKLEKLLIAVQFKNRRGCANRVMPFGKGFPAFGGTIVPAKGGVNPTANSPEGLERNSRR